jgi:hypothetical protein
MTNVRARLLVFVNEIFIDDAKCAHALIGIVVISSSSMDDGRGVIGFFNRDPSSRAVALSLRTEK